MLCVGIHNIRIQLGCGKQSKQHLDDTKKENDFKHREKERERETVCVDEYRFNVVVVLCGMQKEHAVIKCGL